MLASCAKRKSPDLEDNQDAANVASADCGAEFHEPQGITYEEQTILEY